MFSSTILHKTIQFGLCKFYQNIHEKIISVFSLNTDFSCRISTPGTQGCRHIISWLLSGILFCRPKMNKKNRLIIEKHWNVIRKVYEPVFFHHIQFPDKESDHIIHFSIITVLCLNIKLVNHRIMTFCGFPISS